MTRKNKWPSRLTIIRHGQSRRNAEKDKAKLAGADKNLWICEGIRDQDIELTETGILQAQAAGEFLNEEQPLIDTILISPYKRAIDTANYIHKELDYMPSVVYDERLREIEFGLLDGMSKEGIQQYYPSELIRREREGKYWYRPPGGESRPDVALRIHSILGTLTRDYRDKHVLVVCHSVVVLVFRRLLERWSEADYLSVDKENDVKNCGITTYDNIGGKLALMRYNYQAPTD